MNKTEESEPNTTNKNHHLKRVSVCLPEKTIEQIKHQASNLDRSFSYCVRKWVHDRIAEEFKVNPC